MRMRVSVVFVGVVLTVAGAIALDAQGKGKPAPQPVIVTATIQTVPNVTVDNDRLGSYTAGGGVLSQIYDGTGDWVLDLTEQTGRSVWLTFVPPTAGSPPTGNYNARVLSRCFDGNDNITGFLAITTGGGPNGRCSLRVGFTVGRVQYVLVMSPLHDGTGWVTVSCAGNGGDGKCNHWTVTPTGNNGKIANLYEIGKAGREIYKASYENTFAIDVTR